jgi:hypothetical protein
LREKTEDEQEIIDFDNDKKKKVSKSDYILQQKKQQQTEEEKKEEKEKKKHRVSLYTNYISITIYVIILAIYTNRIPGLRLRPEVKSQALQKIPKSQKKN